MNNSSKVALASIAAAIGLGLSAPAAADDHRRHRGHGQQHWNKHHHGHPVDRHVIRDRVVVYRPAYVQPHAYYYPQPQAYYYAPPPRYPGIVLSVDVPPLVIPLR